MDCNGISNLLSAFLDEELGPEERRMVRQHLFGCSQCQNALRELKQLHRMLGSMESVLPPIDFASELRREVIEPSVRLVPGSRLVPAGVWTLAAAAAIAGLFFIGSVFQVHRGQPQDYAEEAPPSQIIVNSPASEPHLFPAGSASAASTLPSSSPISSMPAISASPASSWSVTPASQSLFDSPGTGEPVLFPLGR